MASGNRPGGLTALAVVNFIWGGFSCLGAIGAVALIALMGTITDRAATQDLPPEQLAQIEAMSEVGDGLFIVLAVISLVTAVLLIASGIGYLKLKKFLGRTLGNVTAILGVVSTLGSAVALPAAIGGGFNIMVLVGLIFPLLTLFLLNVTFKEDFVN